MTDTRALLNFLQSQRTLAIATTGEDGAWIANVFFGADNDCQLYFVSNEKTNIKINTRKKP